MNRFAFNVFNYFALQVVWLVCVLYGTEGDLLYPTVYFVGFLCIHFFLTPQVRSDAILCVVALVGGMSLDTVWSAMGIVSYGQNVMSPIAPIWIAYLWVAFALTINHCMGWLKGRYVLVSVFAAVSGPLSFYGASKLSDITFNTQLIAFVCLAVTWGAFVPMLVKLATMTSKPSSKEQVLDDVDL